MVVSFDQGQAGKAGSDGVGGHNPFPVPAHEFLRRFGVNGLNAEPSLVIPHPRFPINFILCVAEPIRPCMAATVYFGVESATEPRLHRIPIPVGENGERLLQALRDGFARQQFEQFELFVSRQFDSVALPLTPVSAETVRELSCPCGEDRPPATGTLHIGGDALEASGAPVASAFATAERVDYFHCDTGGGITVWRDEAGYFIEVIPPQGDDSELVLFRFKGSRHWSGLDPVANDILTKLKTATDNQRFELVEALNSLTGGPDKRQGGTLVSPLLTTVAGEARIRYANRITVIEPWDPDDKDLVLRLLEGRGTASLAFTNPPFLSGNLRKIIVSVTDKGVGYVTLCSGNTERTLGRAQYRIDLSRLTWDDRKEWLSNLISEFNGSQNKFPGPVGAYLKKFDETGFVYPPDVRNIDPYLLDSKEPHIWFANRIQEEFKKFPRIEKDRMENIPIPGGCVLVIRNQSGDRIELTIGQRGINEVLIFPRNQAVSEDGKSLAVRFRFDTEYQLDSDDSLTPIREMARAFASENGAAHEIKDGRNRGVRLHAEKIVGALEARLNDGTNGNGYHAYRCEFPKARSERIPADLR